MRRLVVGAFAGITFAATFFLASVAVTRGGYPAFLGYPEGWVEGARQYNERGRDVEGFEPIPVPTLVGEPKAETPPWAEPFWAGLAAAFGQALMLAVWFLRPRGRRPARHARIGVATGLMWVWIVPLFVVKLWFLYVMLVTSGNYWASAFGEPLLADPLVPVLPFGAAALALAAVVALEPWRGIQMEYRCGWWPAASVALTVGFGALLYTLGLVIARPG